MSALVDNLPHIGLKGFRDNYAAVSVLVVFYDGDEDAGQG